MVEGELSLCREKQSKFCTVVVNEQATLRKD